MSNGQKALAGKVMMKANWAAWCLLLAFLFMPTAALADVCATVKIEIRQELTLERQAFDAHMRINNDLTHITLENVNIEVQFTDENGGAVLASSDPNSADAQFYIRTDSMENIDDISGAGQVPPATAADIHWLIIPSPGSANANPQGTLYYVGARLTYTVGGEENATDVAPDYIFVKPLPELTLDYFLPRDVYADDPFTTEIEPPELFSLGARVQNNGHGTARNLKIESAQPEIVENELGLLIDFVIQGSQIGLAPAENTLLINFGDIEPSTSKMARWLMTTSLSGRFVAFDAEFTHADELGGTLTSLIDAVNTHTLVHEVLVDEAGRDLIYDFLALDGDVYRVYESNGPDTPVVNHSGAAALSFSSQGGGQRYYTLTTPVTAGFMVIRLPDPENGQRLLTAAVRSDGKQIKRENIWLSRTQNEDHSWNRWVCLFDANTTGSYTLTYEDMAAAPQPPVIQLIPDRTVTEGSQLSFVVEASDPNGTIPALSAAPLPAGAQFTDAGDGSAIFDWTPQVGQAGTYTPTYTASDGQLTASRQAAIMVCSVDDTDCDHLPDDWEISHFGDLTRDGTGDADGDGITDFEEYQNGTDPNVAYTGPSVPGIVSPVDGAEVFSRQPTITIDNRTGGGDIRYTFELYADGAYTQLVVTDDNVTPGTDTTQWAVPVALEDNATYYWRVRASDGSFRSLWRDGRFTVNTVNDPPAPLAISYPADAAQVDTVAPTLEVINTSDPDHDLVLYAFTVYTDQTLTQVVAASPNIVPGENGVTAWTVDINLTDGESYAWQVTAADTRGATQLSDPVSFTVNLHNQAPTAPQISAPAENAYLTASSVDLIVTNATDGDGDTLTYRFELDTVPTFDSPALRTLAAAPEGTTTTRWALTGLSDDATYYWRVRATDGMAVGPWAAGTFFVNSQDETPLTPVLRNPGDGAVVGTITPVLHVFPAADSEKDLWLYRYEVYTSEDLGSRVAFGEASGPDWPVFPALTDRGAYWWRVQVEDTGGRVSPWSDPAGFRVDEQGVNASPSLQFKAPAAPIAATNATFTLEWTDEDTDDDARIALYYDTDRQGADGTLIVEDLSEGGEGADGTYAWNISGLPEGTYYIYALIHDDDSTFTTYAPGSVTILPGTSDDTPPTLQVTPPGGSYTEAQSVTLTTDEPADIYYTLDGADPTTSSTLYADVITISENTTLKCLAVDPAGNASDIVTEIYRFGPPALHVQVSASQGRQLSDVRVYAFTESGSYTGQHQTTDSNGTAVFNPDDFSDGNYKFRADYLGGHFWSEVVPLPATQMLEVVIEEETADVTVTSAGSPAAGIRVYLFSESGVYLGTYQVTDANGQVFFDLPTGHTYTFRADVLGGQYWSSASEIVAGGPNTIAVDAGGGRLQVRIQEDPDTPMVGVRAYLFTAAGRYLGQNQLTDDAGEVFFDLPAGEFVVRVDYLGDQFWTEAIAFTTDTTIALSIPHQDVTVTVDSVYSDDIQPLEGVRGYLFSEAGGYLGRYQTSDAAGNLIFHLPQKPCKVRLDYMGRQYWSEVFTWTNPTVRLALADAQITVTGAGSPVVNQNVYVFSLSDTYLGRVKATDENGQVTFRLPEGDYKFRANYLGNQYWSDETLLTAHLVTPVGISVGGGNFTLTAQKAAGDPLAGVNCYVFSDTDTYLGLNGATNEAGEVSFDLDSGLYKFRIDYLGSQFWSEVVDVPSELSSTIAIAHETVDVSVISAGVPAEATRVYLFTENGAYLGQYKETDGNGQVSFLLPVDHTYQFRANIMRNHYWSDPITVTSGGANSVTIDAGGGTWQVTVQEAPGIPLAGVNVHLFNQDGSYLGASQVTDTAGAVTFDVPQGVYKVRANYMGYLFWSTDTAVGGNLSTPLEIPHQPIQITVTGTLQGVAEPLPGLRVHVFNTTDAYTGVDSVTDANGQVTFNLPLKDYKARVDYLAEHYWSAPFNGANAAVDIDMANVNVTVTGGGLPRPGINVYVFSAADTYLGLTQATDSSGQAQFTLPAGTYRFRADFQGNQYWSGPEVIEAGATHDAIISVGGGTFSFSVESSPGVPLAGARGYVFNGSDTYIGLSGTTDDNGEMSFDLGDGDFKFRVDHLGYQFWSDVYTVPGTLSGSLNLNQQDVVVSVEGLYQAPEPLEGLRAYLFTPGGTYLGTYLVTDAAGQVAFNLPDQLYKVRVDYLGNQFWSSEFQLRNTTVTINQGKAVVHVQRLGADVEGAQVYLFREDDTYLGRHETTPADGRVEFILPDRPFKFRVDQGGAQTWSSLVNIQPGMDTTVAIELN